MKKASPFLEYVLYDVFGENEPITYRAMMGAFILYFEGRAFAIVSGDELYFKGAEHTVDWYVFRGSKQFSYERKGEEVFLMYFSVSPEVYEDKTVFVEWLDIALSSTSVPKERKKKLVN